VAGRDQQDQIGVTGVELVLDHPLGPDGLGARILEPTGGQVVGDPAPHRARHGEDRHCAQQDPTVASHGEASQAVEHHEFHSLTAEIYRR